MKAQGKIQLNAAGEYEWLLIRVGTDQVATVNIENKKAIVEEHKNDITVMVDNKAIYTVETLTVINEKNEELRVYIPVAVWKERQSKGVR